MLFGGICLSILQALVQKLNATFPTQISTKTLLPITHFSPTISHMNTEQTYIYFIMFEGTYAIDPEEVNALLVADEHITVHAWDDDHNKVLFDKLYYGTENDLDKVLETGTNMAQALDFLTHVETVNVNRMNEEDGSSEIIWESNKTRP